MRIKWEPLDVMPGLAVRSTGIHVSMVGYDPTRSADEQYTLTSLSDGCLTHAGCSKESLARVLTEGRYAPYAITIRERSAERYVD